jgi:cation transport regulator ChaB
MPYSSVSDLPPAVKDKYTAHQQAVFLAAFNSAWNGSCKGRKDHEACCFAIAHAAAQNQKGHEEMDRKLTSRMLDVPLKDLKISEVDSGLLIKDVKILAEGTWTDSYQQTPCHYSETVLKDHADNWHSNGYWLRHSGGSPRAIDEKVGEVRNPRYLNGAVLGDVFLHLASSRSRDYAEMVKRNLVESVSAELATADTYDAANKRYEATYLEFYGVAAVDRGACKVCGLRGHESSGPSEGDSMGEPQKEPEKEKTLAEAFAAFKVELLSEIDKKIAGIAPTVKPEELKAFSDKLDTLMKAYEERFKAIENAPVVKTLSEKPPEANTAEKELDKLETMRKLPKIVGKDIIIE